MTRGRTVNASSRPARTVRKFHGYPSKAVWLSVCVLGVRNQELIRQRAAKTINRAVSAWCILRNNEKKKSANVHRSRIDFSTYADGLSDLQFQKRFRLNKLKFNEILDKLRLELEPNESMALLSSGSSISAAWRLAITLRMLAGGTPVGVADMVHVSENSIWPIVRQVVPLIIKHYSSVVYFDPMNQTQLDQLSCEFAHSSDGIIRGCVGAVDGISICIRKPLKCECRGKPWHFYNRKGFYSLNLQAMCDKKN